MDTQELFNFGVTLMKAQAIQYDIGKDDVAEEEIVEYDPSNDGWGYEEENEHLEMA